MPLTRTIKLIIPAVISLAWLLLAENNCPGCKSTCALAAEPDVACVNGLGICAEEFKSLLAAERAGVFAYFREKYGAQYGPNFWTSRYQNQGPTDALQRERPHPRYSLLEPS